MLNLQKIYQSILVCRTNLQQILFNPEKNITLKQTIKQYYQNDIDKKDSAHSLYLLIRKTSDLAFAARNIELRKQRVTPMQAAVLNIIHNIGRKATPAEISRHLIRLPHSVSSLIDRMEADGLVRRVKDLERKNLVRVKMTRKGKSVYSRLSERKATHDMMSDLSEEELQQMIEWLLKIQARIHQQVGKTESGDQQGSNSL
jgi:DNA-binding MarR family transcriptional regulator